MWEVHARDEEASVPVALREFLNDEHNPDQ
jgi:hypothetical protein